MKFSLIIGTFNNFDDLPNLFESLSAQTHKDFEIILVDQNTTEIIKDQCSRYSGKLEINYQKTEEIGLARARNIGIKNARGDIFSFMDDDCVFPGTTLQSVHEHFIDHENCDIVAISTRAPGTNDFLSYTPVRERRKLTINNIYHLVTSIGLFVKKNGQCFDESFGAGGTFHSSEEFDYVFHLLNHGATGEYIPDIFVYHPELEKNNKEYFHKIRRNSIGHGAFMRKNISISSPFVFANYLFILFIKPLVGIIYHSSRFDRTGVLRQLNYLTGRITGYIRYRARER